MHGGTLVELNDRDSWPCWGAQKASLTRLLPTRRLFASDLCPVRSLGGGGLSVFLDHRSGETGLERDGLGRLLFMLIEFWEKETTRSGPRARASALFSHCTSNRW